MTVRVEERTRKTLDKIAETLDRDRSYIVNEAIESYIDVYQWQVNRIREGLRQAREGRFATDAEVQRLRDKIRRKARS